MSSEDFGKEVRILFRGKQDSIKGGAGEISLLGRRDGETRRTTEKLYCLVFQMHEGQKGSRRSGKNVSLDWNNGENGKRCRLTRDRKTTEYY